MRALKTLLFLIPLTLIVSMPALADTCNVFGGFTCNKSTPDIARIFGTGVSAGANMNILGSNTFTFTTKGQADLTGDTLLILAVSPNGAPTGTLNGQSFTSLGSLSSSLPEGGAQNAITAAWSFLGISSSSPGVGYANLGTITGTPMSITASGVATGTIIYAEVVNSDGKIIYITPNSGAGVFTPTATPEPASLTLLGTGLAGLAGLVRRKLAKG